MNHIQTAMADIPDGPYAIEFHPSADDYVYISTRVSSTVPAPAPVRFSYQIFLVVNAILFPGFLWFNELWIAGLVVLGLNIAALLWLLPWFNSQYVRKFYEHVVGPGDRHLARVELTSEGVHYSCDDGESFWPWRIIESVEESDEAIFFFCKGSGFGVRKNGFVYHDEQMAFIRFAQTQRDNALALRQ